jgi:hypothetical protein
MAFNMPFEVLICRKAGTALPRARFLIRAISWFRGFPLKSEFTSVPLFPWWNEEGTFVGLHLNMYSFDMRFEV